MPSSDTNPAPELDLAAALDRLAGMVRLYITLAHEFQLELDTVAPSYARLLAARAMPDAYRLMHSLKGSAATLGASRLAKTAADLAQLCKGASDPAAALAQLGALNSAVEATQAALGAALTTLESGQ